MKEEEAIHVRNSPYQRDHGEKDDVVHPDRKGQRIKDKRNTLGPCRPDSPRSLGEWKIITCGRGLPPNAEVFKDSVPG